MGLFSRGGKVVLRGEINVRGLGNRAVVIRRIRKGENANWYVLEDKFVNIHRGAASVPFRSKNDETARRAFKRQAKRYKAALAA